MANNRFPSVVFALWLAVAAAFLAFFASELLKAGTARTPDQATSAAHPSGQPPQTSRTAEAEVPPRPALPELVTPVQAFDPGSASHVLLAWSTTGMRLATDCDALFSLSAPFADLRAQLVKRGESPEIVTRDVTISYAVEGVEPPSARSAYWKFSASLAGRALEPDTGPSGLRSRGVMTASDKIFQADGVPVMPYATGGGFLPYPTVAVEAHDGEGRLLAATRAVLPVSTELGCAGCHGGGSGAAPTLTTATATRILQAHDRRSSTTLLADAQAGKPLACSSCHAEGEGGQGKGMSLSAAIHGFHAHFLTGQGAEACSSCHPAGGRTGFHRDHHAARGQDCARCHGPMEDHAMALLKGEQGVGREQAGRLMAGLAPRLPAVEARKPHVQQPDCAGCHDFAVRPGPSSLAAGKWTDAPYSTRRDDAAALACQACHGPAHATYPATNPYGPDRDNIQPIQYQGWAKTIGGGIGGGNCATCHTVDMDPETSVHHPIPTRRTLRVSLPSGLEARRPGVMYPHSAHADMDCRTCHHTGYPEGGSLLCSSAGCHDKTDQADPGYFRNAFHGRDFSCNACHQAKRKAGQPAGPVACGACHTVRHQ